MSEDSKDGYNKSKGNSPDLWQKFLTALDDKLQLGLLGQMQKVKSYHFEDDTLFIEPASQRDYEYLIETSHFQQLQILAQAILKVDRVKLKSPDSNA